jgi:carboxymethylenebutenolidase
VTVGDFNRLMARDGHEFDAWLSAPVGPPRGALVILQEIFGVNAHIRAVTDDYAAEGFVTIAPCLFDRVRGGVELGYEMPQIEEGRGYALQIPDEKVLLDINACINVVKHSGPVAVIGYC